MHRLGFTVILVIACTGVTAQQRPDDLARLREIAGTVADAILKKDAKPILSHDRPEFRAEDAAELTDRKSVLYCYLFDTQFFKRAIDLRSVDDSRSIANRR